MIQLSYVEAGAGPAVFLLHAFPLDHTIWDSQIHAINHRYRVVAPDQPGFGGSPPGREGWRLRDVAHAILELADSLEIQTFAVVGISMGGYTAFEIYRAAPERVTALVIANSRARADTPEERQGRTELARAIQEEGIHLLEERVLPRLLRRDPDPEVVESVLKGMSVAHPKAIAQILEAMGERVDSTSLLTRIECPTLVIAGTEDSITKVAESEAMVRSLPNGTLVEITGAGHLSNLENPAAFNEALSAFLDRARA